MFSSRLQNEQTDNLARAFLALESVEDCYRLFEDLFTIRGDSGSFPAAGGGQIGRAHV